MSVPIDAEASYVQIAGIWYRLEYEEVPAIAVIGGPEWRWRQIGARWFRMTTKRQVGEKELRANRLVNTPATD